MEGLEDGQARGDLRQDRQPERGRPSDAPGPGYEPLIPAKSTTAVSLGTTVPEITTLRSSPRLPLGRRRPSPMRIPLKAEPEGPGRSRCSSPGTPRGLHRRWRLLGNGLQPRVRRQKDPWGNAPGERLPSDTSALDRCRSSIEEDRERYRDAMEKEKEQLKRRNPLRPPRR